MNFDTPLSFKQTQAVAADIFRSGAFNAVIIQSMPGTGKNAMMPGLQQDLGLKHRFMVKPGHHENYDFAGLPVPDEKTKRTYMFPTGDLLPNPELKGGCQMVWDEFSDSLSPMQSLICQYVLEGRGNNYEFPENTKHVLLGNSITHRSGANKIITKLTNRCAVIHMMPTVEEILTYAGKAGWAPSVWAFLKMFGGNSINNNENAKKDRDSEFNPTFFNSFDPNDAAQSLKPVFASSRSWEATAKLINYIDAEQRSMEKFDLLPRVASLVGMPVAMAFVDFRCETMTGPDPDDIAAGKRTPYPKKASVLWNLTQCLVQRAKPENVRRIYDWLAGGDNAEFSTLFVIQTLRTKGREVICDDWRELVALPDIRQAMAYND